MLRLVGRADVWPIFPFPEFQPEKRWDPRDLDRVNPGMYKAGIEEDVDLTLARSPDGSLTVVETNPSLFFDSTVHVEKLAKATEESFDIHGGTVLRIKDSRTGSVLHEFHEPMNGRRYVYIYAARFTPDGHHLLVMSSLPDIRIYDVSSGQLLDHLPHVPNGAVAYYPSSDWKHGVVALSTGEIKLIEAEGDRTLAQIDPGDELQTVSYSPDDSRVAVVTVGHSALGAFHSHMRIWRTSNGELLHELRPLEATPNGFGEPTWLPDGKYLLSLASGRFGRLGEVGIWNTESGRYRGTLAECTNPGFWRRFLLSGKYVYETCASGWVLMWNVENALNEISAFEKSLPN